MSQVLRLMVIGAHPDDAEYKAGGLAALYRRLGYKVRFISVTDGGAGHHESIGAHLVARRRAEAKAAALTLGFQYDVWDYPDGSLEPSLTVRERVIREIRKYRPDLVLTHRPNDYHPDHRASSQLVQDACYLLTVPAVCPDTPHLSRDPVIAYLSDDFTRPYPFDPDIVVNIESVFHEKIAMLHEHTSQFYEWLPYNGGYLHEVPPKSEERREWLSARMSSISENLAERYRSRILEQFGIERGSQIQWIEAFEACEYGARLDTAARERLFPFLTELQG